MQGRPAYPHQAYQPPQSQIPYNAPPPIPPAAITPGPYAPTPSLLPGPFILLLLLPSIPLLLFSLGARPPDTSHLPFTTSDIFTTGAFVTVTMTIVICLGVYPETGGAVWAFIRDGANGEWDMSYWDNLKSWTGVSTGRTGSSMRQSVSTGPMGITEQSQSQSQMKVGWTWKYVFDERYRRWIKVKVPLQQAVDSPRTHLRPSPKGFQTLSIKHLSSLRSAFPEWYSEYKPRLIPSLLVIAFTLFFLILLTGGILGSAYDTESSGEKRQSSYERGSSGSRMSSWVERELRKRKEEKGKPEITLKRIKEEGKKEMEGYRKKGKDELKKFEKKREGEKEMLKRELKKRGLPLVGLEDKRKNKEKKKVEEKKKREDDDGGEDGDGEKKESKGDKMKKLLLGERGGVKKDSEENAKAGPGWEIADTALAQNTLARSQANAQQMASKLKGGG